MKEQEKVYDEKKQAEKAHEKKPYETPMLTKLGNVKHLTHGQLAEDRPDTFSISA